MNFISKFSKIIKYIVKRKNKFVNISKKDAYFLFSSILKNKISDLELGIILMVLRIKGEKIEEILGFLKAIENSMKLIKFSVNEKYSPIIIPSYNGTKKIINFIPLLALLLARKKIPVLIHGITTNINRITTFEIFKFLGINNANTLQDIVFYLKKKNIVFISIKKFFPELYRILSLKNFLGIRNISSFLVKLIQPFITPSLRLISYTHIEYFKILLEIFTKDIYSKKGGVFLTKSTEGEVFINNNANVKQINCIFLGKNNILNIKNNKINFNNILFNNAKFIANWTKNVLLGKEKIPIFIKKQVKICINMSKEINLHFKK